MTRKLSILAVALVLAASVAQAASAEDGPISGGPVENPQTALHP